MKIFQKIELNKLIYNYAPVAQLIERLATDQEVLGSNPSSAPNMKKIFKSKELFYTFVYKFFRKNFNCIFLCIEH